MVQSISRLFLPFLIALLSLGVGAQKTDQLARSIPEREGVSSAGILKFLDAAQKSKHEFHSIMVLRHGKVIAEGWWNPYRADLKHTMYSCSKSFTATAIGFAGSEKRLSVEDMVISFFPDELPDTISNHLKALTVKENTVEAWGRSEMNPVGGWYGLKKGLRGRFGVYVPPLLEVLGLAEVTHDAKNNKMRAK